MSQPLGKLRVLIATITLLLVTLPLGYSKGQGIVGIDFLETDRTAYEIGENVNVTTAWHIYYDNSYEYSEGIITCLRGLSPLASKKWLNETEGYHVHGMRILLDPNTWTPGQNGENGTIESTISLLPEGGYQLQRQSFMVMRANQNCTLTNAIPTHPTANVSMVSLSLRIYNRNNSSFGVTFNKVYFNIVNPYGFPIAVNNSCLSDLDGNLVVSFNPQYTYGTYSLSLKSAENDRYVEGRFNYSINVERSAIPTDLSLDWKYIGQVYNSTTSFALEPVEITSRLMCSLNGSGISGQQLELRVIDSSNLATVCQTKETTNTSGSIACIFKMPYEGEFILEATYDGLANSWLASTQILASKINAAARELSIVQLAQLPEIVVLNHSYTVGYLVVDALDKKPVHNVDVKAWIDSHLLAEGMTDNHGQVEFELCLPADEPRFAGNDTLIIESSYKVMGRICRFGVLSLPLICKIPTIIKLEVSPLVMIQGDEMVSVLSELLSFDLSPIPNQNITLLIFTDQGQTPSNRIVRTTDSRGRCNASFRLLQDGTAGIIAIFGGNYTFIASNCTCSVSVLPVFQERLSSSIPTVTLACFLAVITLISVNRTKRKAKWNDMLVSQLRNQNI